LRVAAGKLSRYAIPNAVDGTPCSANGVCKNGACISADLTGFFLAWLTGNPQFAIPAYSFIGLILLCCVYGCCKTPEIPQEDNERIEIHIEQRNSTIHQNKSTDNNNRSKRLVLESEQLGSSPGSAIRQSATFNGNARRESDYNAPKLKNDVIQMSTLHTRSPSRAMNTNGIIGEEDEHLKVRTMNNGEKNIRNSPSREMNNGKIIMKKSPSRAMNTKDDGEGNSPDKLRRPSALKKKQTKKSAPELSQDEYTHQPQPRSNFQTDDNDDYSPDKLKRPPTLKKMATKKSAPELSQDEYTHQPQPRSNFQTDDNDDYSPDKLKRPPTLKKMATKKSAPELSQDEYTHQPHPQFNFQTEDRADGSQNKVRNPPVLMKKPTKMTGHPLSHVDENNVGYTEDALWGQMGEDEVKRSPQKPGFDSPMKNSGMDIWDEQ
jgi:hypothetical protein